MDKNLFQNDNIVGNSLIGIDFRGSFGTDENDLVNKLKDILNRDVLYSNIDYKLLEPTDYTAVLIKDGSYYEVKTPQYSYYEMMFILPKIFEFMKLSKDIRNTYVHFRIGYNKSVCDISNVNITKFVFEFKENMIFKLLGLSKDDRFIKLADMCPKSLELCGEGMRKQFDNLKYDEFDTYGIDFSHLVSNYITFKYAEGIDYRKYWEDLLKCVNHTIITLYNVSMNPYLTDDEQDKLNRMDTKYKDVLNSFDCYELFRDKYRNVKLTRDLDSDVMMIGIVFPAIKERLYGLVVKNGIRDAEINYDTDLSKLQIRDVELKNCHHLSDVDIVNGEFVKCTIRNCDIYDSKIDDSTITDCNLFGFGNCGNDRLMNCFVSRNIKLKDCAVSGSRGKMGGIMKGGSLKNTTVIMSMSDIDDGVEKYNVNEIQ